MDINQVDLSDFKIIEIEYQLVICWGWTGWKR